MELPNPNRTRSDLPQFDLEANKNTDQTRPSFWSRSRWRLSPYVRVRLVLAVALLAAAGLIYNLYTLQARDGGDLKLSEKAIKQNIQTDNVPATRGQIRTADGLLLATNIPTYKLYTYPDGMNAKQTDISVKTLAPLLPNLPLEKLKAALTFVDRDHLVWQSIATDLDSAAIAKFQALKPFPTGVFIAAGAKRVYPNGSLLGHLLGFAHNGTNEADGLVGAYGVEGFYDDQLKGQPGKIVGQRDVNGDPLAIGSTPMQIEDPIAGDDLTLTIDSGVQHIVDRELAAGMKAYQPEMGTIIVMNPNNGAILAYANSQAQYPAFDPNKWSEMSYEQLLDPVVSNVYEPGSTFKIFTAAIGMDIGAVQPETSAGNLAGCTNKYGAHICNWNSQGHSNQTVIDTLRFSSNVGADWIAEHIKPEVYYDYMHKFGFSQPTGVDLGGEGEGIMPVPGTQWWIPLTYYQQAFGQGIAVTPLQLVSGVATVANGGKKVLPHVVAQVTQAGKIVPQNMGDGTQIISPETSKKMNFALTEAMTGDGSETALVCVPGYKLAAKTGTAQIPLKGGGYEDGAAGHTIGSTIAYGPSDNPQVVVYVRFDRTKDIQWGSNTAGPVVQKVMSQLMTYYKIPPSGPNTCKYYK